MSSAPSPLIQERERARRLATGIVALAMALAGVTLVILSVVMIVRGGAGLLPLAILVALLGLGLGAAGFFFQLVPLRVDELAEQKREYDRRRRGP